MATMIDAPPRAYEASHGFINFQLDLSSPLAELWLYLGEVNSKIDHVRGAHPPRTSSTSSKSSARG